MPPSKRTSAPARMEIPSASRSESAAPPIGTQPAPPQPAPPMTTRSPFPSVAWCPPYPHQSMTNSSTPYWIPGLQHPGMASSSAQGHWWAPPSSKDTEDSDLQVWGLDSIPPGGMFNFLSQNTPRHGSAQPVSNGNSQQPPAQHVSTGNSKHPINIGDDTESDCPRTGKRLLFTKEEDVELELAMIE